MSKLLHRVFAIMRRYGGNFMANIFQQGIRFVVLYAAAKMLGPAQFGSFNLVLIVTGYLLSSNMGAVNGMKRQIPLFYLQKGEPFVRSAFYSILNFNWICTAVTSFLTSVILIISYEYTVVSGILMMVLSLSLNTYFSLQNYLTATGNWSELFRLQASCGAFLGITLLSLFFSDPYLLYIFYAFPFFFSSVLFFRKNGYQRVMNRQIIVENVKVGFPIMIAGFVFLLFQTTDRLVVSKFYSESEFGYYSFAAILVLALNLLTNLSSEIIAQRASIFYSRSQDSQKLFIFLLKYSSLLQVALLAFSAGLVIAAWYLVPLYFHEYVSALPVLRNIVIAYLIQQLALAAANYYYVIGKQVLYNLLLVAACFVNVMILVAPLLLSNALPDFSYVSVLYIWSSCVYIGIIYFPFLFRKLQNFFYPVPGKA